MKVRINSKQLKYNPKYWDDSLLFWDSSVLWDEGIIYQKPNLKVQVQSFVPKSNIKSNVVKVKI